MSIPSMIELAGVVFFVVVKREVPVFEPDDLQASSTNAFRVEPLIVHAHQTVRGNAG